MVSMTYVLSFLFSSESGAQNGVILLNFLLGALGSTVILALRMLDNVRKIAKIIQNILSLLPSFCFNFGYSMILNKYMMLMSEYENWYLLKENIILKKFEFLLSPILFLAVEFVFYTQILIIIELFSYFSCEVSDYRINSEINDSKVLKEIDIANNDFIVVTDENGVSRAKEFSVRIKNLQKNYSNGLCSTTQAIKNMSFCVEPGWIVRIKWRW